MRVSCEMIGGVAVFALIVVRPAAPWWCAAQRSTVRTGAEGLVRRARPRASRDLAPRGKVFVHGEIWNAAAAEPVAREAPVEVTAVEGILLGCVHWPTPSPTSAGQRPRLPSPPRRTVRCRSQQPVESQGGADARATSDPARRRPRSVPAHAGSASCASTSARSSSASAACWRAPRGPGLVLIFWPHRPHGEDLAAHGRARRAAAGRHHPRQRLGEGQRGGLLPRRRPGEGGGRGRELPLRHQPARADHAALGARPGRARRAALRARQAQRPAPGDHRPRTPIPGASRCRRSRSSTSICRRRCSARWRARPRRSARSGPRSSTPRASSRPRSSWPRRPRSSPTNPVTLQLRYLQTLTEIAAEHNSTIVFPLPIEMLRAFQRWPRHEKSRELARSSAVPRGSSAGGGSVRPTERRSAARRRDPTPARRRDD